MAMPLGARRPGPREGLSRVGRPGRSFRHRGARALLSLALLVLGAGTTPLLAAGPASAAPTAPAFHPVTLLNGWRAERVAAFGTPAVARSAQGVVYLRGDVGGGSDSSVFTLPKADRPTRYTYLPVETKGTSATGGLGIYPNGLVAVFTPNASGVPTSAFLSGLSFVARHTSLEWSPLTLENGWEAPDPTTYGKPAVAKGPDGVVYLSGALAGGDLTKVGSFVVPAADEPPDSLWEPTYTLNGHTGSFYGEGGGVVEEVGDDSNATSYTSLAGLQYPTVKQALGMTSVKLPLKDGWKPYEWEVARAVKSPVGVVYLEGTIKAGSTHAPAVQLPAGFRPGHEIERPIWTTEGTVGTIRVTSSGAVTVSGPEAQGASSLWGIAFLTRS